MASVITDIWFRSGLPLEEIAAQLGLSDVSVDAENYWEWAIGNLDYAKIDVTRTHTKPPQDVDTRLFNSDGLSLPNFLAMELIRRLRTFTSATIYCGRWEYLSGNEYNLVVVSQFDGPETKVGDTR